MKERKGKREGSKVKRTYTCKNMVDTVLVLYQKSKVVKRQFSPCTHSFVTGVVTYYL